MSSGPAQRCHLCRTANPCRSSLGAVHLPELMVVVAIFDLQTDRVEEASSELYAAPHRGDFAVPYVERAAVGPGTAEPQCLLELQVGKCIRDVDGELRRQNGLVARSALEQGWKCRPVDPVRRSPLRHRHAMPTERTSAPISPGRSGHRHLLSPDWVQRPVGWWCSGPAKF